MFKNTFLFFHQLNHISNEPIIFLCIHAFYIKTSKFWPTLLVFNFLGNFSLNSSEAVLIFKSIHKNNSKK